MNATEENGTQQRTPHPSASRTSAQLTRAAGAEDPSSASAAPRGPILPSTPSPSSSGTFPVAHDGSWRGGDDDHPAPRVLVVDDEAKSLEFSRDILELAGYRVETAESVVDALGAMGETTFDAVLTDIKMPGLSGIELLARIRREHRELPVLILTGFGSLETAKQAIEHGASEYLVKPVDYEALKKALGRAVDRYRLVQENRRLLERLRAANDELAALNEDLERRVREKHRDLVLERDLLDHAFASLPQGLCVLDPDDEPTRTNRAWRRLGPAVEEAVHRLADELRALREDQVGPPLRELQVRGADGEDLVLEAQLRALKGGRALVVLDDKTQERRLEEELIQAEKLSSLGLLASGIVHDLSNPITAVLGTAEVLVARAQGQFEEEAAIIMSAAEHMREVCIGLSDFARRASAGERARAPLNDVVERAVSYARFSRSFKELTPHIELADEGPDVLANGTELIQVVLNLIVNGADASPRGGNLWIRTLREGDHGVVEIQDEGSGIDPAIRERVFDAFYTTKPRGKGTGLGLYMSRRIVRRLGGDLGFTCPAEGGTRFRIRLPTVAGA